MVRVTLCLQLLLLVLIMKQSDANADQCSELQNEIVQLEHELNNTEYQKHNNGENAGRCKVSVYFTAHVSSLG
jgi:hypothetical protein